MDDIWNLVISLRIVGKISKRRERERERERVPREIKFILFCFSKYVKRTFNSC
jgi:hypothetical protein